MGLFLKRKVNWNNGLLFDYFMVEDNDGDLRYMADVRENEGNNNIEILFRAISKTHEQQPMKWLAMKEENGKPHSIILSWKKKGIYSTSCFSVDLPPKEGQKLLTMIAERAGKGIDEYESFRIISMDKF